MFDPLKALPVDASAPAVSSAAAPGPQKHNKDSGRGTPQGAPISPLLANLYMRRFLLGWKQQGWEKKLKARIVNFADDF